jgi:hypothetical protein
MAAPQVLYSDDGILTIEWHAAGRGVVILLSEDGTFSVAQRSDNVGYGENWKGKDLRRVYAEITEIQST